MGKGREIEQRERKSCGKKKEEKERRKETSIRRRKEIEENSNGDRTHAIELSNYFISTSTGFFESVQSRFDKHEMDAYSMAF